MSIIFQILVIFLVGLIAYWWANQGLFSSLLHFVATVCAGAIALAFWEPLVVGVLLRNTFFDQYAWGLGLIVLFGVSLLGFRVLFDRIAPSNVFVPHWANLTFGGLIGLGTGILTTGLLLLGMGHTQSAERFLGLKLTGRENPTIGVTHGGDVETLWVPAHKWTARFYEFVSAGAFRPDFEGVPLRQINPLIDEQAFSLLRDTYKNGTSRITVPPESVTINRASQSDTRVFVTFTVSNKAFDYARQFIMSNSQVRLLSYENGDVRNGDVSVAHPVRWTQKVQEDTATQSEAPGGDFPSKTFIFDDQDHYMTSIDGQQAAEFGVEFEKSNAPYNVKPGYVPKYIQIKGVRFALNQVETVSGADRGLSNDSIRTSVPDDPTAPIDTTGEAIFVNANVRPLNASINTLVGDLHHDGNRYLTYGRKVWNKSDMRANRQNRIEGVYSARGASIVQVNVSRSSVASIYGPAREAAGDAAGPVLVDSEGRVYRPKGFILDRPREIEVMLSPNDLIESVSDLPHLPTSDTAYMRLFFEVTNGVTITSFRLDDETVCRTNLRVVPGGL